MQSVKDALDVGEVGILLHIVVLLNLETVNLVVDQALYVGQVETLANGLLKLKVLLVLRLNPLELVLLLVFEVVNLLHLLLHFDVSKLFVELLKLLAIFAQLRQIAEEDLANSLLRLDIGVLLNRLSRFVVLEWILALFEA